MWFWSVSLRSISFRIGRCAAYLKEDNTQFRFGSEAWKKAIAGDQRRSHNIGSICMLLPKAVDHFGGLRFRHGDF